LFWSYITRNSKRVIFIAATIKLQEGQNVGSYIRHSATGIVTLDRSSLTVDEELFEIPADVVVPDWRVVEMSRGSKEISCAGTASFKEGVERMFPVSVDFHLAENGHPGLEIVTRPNETDPVQHLQIRCSRFLLSKLVAREGEDGQIVGIFSL